MFNIPEEKNDERGGLRGLSIEVEVSSTAPKAPHGSLPHVTHIKSWLAIAVKGWTTV
jgi:hypothetical protein